MDASYRAHVYLHMCMCADGECKVTVRMHVHVRVCMCADGVCQVTVCMCMCAGDACVQMAVCGPGVTRGASNTVGSGMGQITLTLTTLTGMGQLTLT